jgi:predicted NBD/HSP70 family sugar kinase
MPVLIGEDFGQRRSPAALCFAEVETREEATHHLVRHLERLPRGTPYPEVAGRIARITDRVSARTGERPTVHVDATGVGQPVVDLLRDQVRSGEVVPVWFMAGERRTERWEDHAVGG